MTITTQGPLAGRTGSLPAWKTVLAVVAHPDDESFGLGAVLDAFARNGAAVSVLCLTQGAASSLGPPGADLSAVRALELQQAAQHLGVTSAALEDYPDGGLAGIDPATLSAAVLRELDVRPAEGLVVFDPTGVTGHPDHTAASAAALSAAQQRDLPVLGWTLPIAIAEQLREEFDVAFVGHRDADLDLVVPVERDRQRMASLAHASQAVPTSVLWRRLELRGDVESLRWLRRPVPAPAPAEVQTMQVHWQADDRFAIEVRGHTIIVDQPPEVGGEDLGPTPTELFVASLASCVAFYARRYLRRHHLDPTGLQVTTRFAMGTRPARVAVVDLEITLPTDLPPGRREGLLAQAAHCTVHNSITHAPGIEIRLTAADEPAG